MSVWPSSSRTPIDLLAGSGIQASYPNGRARIDLVDVPIVATKRNGVYVVDTGTDLSEITTGLRLLLKPDADSDGPALLSVDGIGPLPWLDAEGSPLYQGLVRRDAFTLIRGDTERGWLLDTSSLGAAGLKFDVSGPVSGRALYNRADAGFVYLATDGGDDGATWVLYTKRSATANDWSSGYPIKASPARSTLEAQTAAAQAEDRRIAATAQAGISTVQAGVATQKAGVATDQAALARLAAIDALSTAATIGLQVYDFSLDSEASPTDDWSL